MLLSPLKRHVRERYLAASKDPGPGVPGRYRYHSRRILVNSLTHTKPPRKPRLGRIILRTTLTFKLNYPEVRNVMLVHVPDGQRCIYDVAPYPRS